MTNRLDEEQQDTFKPINVSRDRTELGKTINLADSIDAMFPAVEETPVAPVAPTTVEPEVVDTQEPDTFDSMFPEVSPEELPVEPTVQDDLSFDSMFPEIPEIDPVVDAKADDTLSALGKSMAQEKASAGVTADLDYEEYSQIMLPEGVESGSYSPDDLAGDAKLFGVIETYMVNRMGSRAVKNLDKQELVDMFLQSRRNVAMAGNMWSVGTEVDYISKISSNPEELKEAAQAYVLYENMAGITSDDYSWSELGQSSLDVMQGIVTDPMTWLSFGVGKVFGTGFTKVGAEVLKQQIQKTVVEQMVAGVAKETIKKNATLIANRAAIEAAKQTTESLAKFSAANVGKSTLSKLASNAALREVAGTVVFDAAAGSLAEYLYQKTLVDSKAQKDINQYSVGLAAVATIAIGGVAAVRVGTRGYTQQTLPSQDVKAGSPAEAVRTLRVSIREHLKDIKAKNIKAGTEEVPVKVKQPKVKISNPGGDWLVNKKKKAAESRAKGEPNSYQANLGEGATTGFVTAKLDPKALADIKGAMGEEAFRDSGTKLTKLEAKIAKEGYKPNPIMIHVREDGVPFVAEGNHRLAEALKSNRGSIEVEIQWKNGAEEVDGILMPNKLPLAKKTKKVGTGKGSKKVINTSFEGKKARAADSHFTAPTTKFFDNLLLGTTKELDDGTVVVVRKGLAHVMQEQGFYFTKLNEDDRVTNHFANFMRTNFTQEDVIALLKAGEQELGQRIRGFTKANGDPLGKYKTGPMAGQPKYPTPQQFSDAFANKISKAGQDMSIINRAAQLIDQGVPADLIESHVRGAAFEGITKTKNRPLTKGEQIVNYLDKNIVAAQSRYVRALVTHLSTSNLNVVGWGVASGIGSTSDLMRGFAKLGVGAAELMMGKASDGLTNMHVGKSLIAANLNRINLLIDMDMTAQAYASATLRNSGALAKMARTQAGGVDMGKGVDDIAESTKAGRLLDNIVEYAQTGTLVKTQDLFTKSQEFVFQMDKALRIRYNMSWKQFYNAKNTDATKIMSTKDYAELEESVVAQVMRNTFSESYKGPTMLGKAAGMMEEARTIPIVGMFMPFGKFYNSTVAFTARNLPMGGNVLLKYFFGKFEDTPYDDLIARTAITGGILYSVVDEATDRRKEGLSLYEFRDESTGVVKTVEYDYPVSLYAAGGMALSYVRDGEAPPMDLLAQISVDFGISGLTRGLTTTSNDLAEGFKYLLKAELDMSGEAFLDAFSKVGSQYSSGMTRMLDGPDTLLGVVMGTDRRPTNVKDGNKFWGKTLTNLDNTVQLLTGATQGDPLFSAIEGPLTDTTGRQSGMRTVLQTDAMRMMNVLGFEYWTEGPSSKINNLAAGASNAFKKEFFYHINEAARNLLLDDKFINDSRDQQIYTWKEAVNEAKDIALLSMTTSMDTYQNTAVMQMEIIDKYSRGTMLSAMKELDLPTNIGELSLSEIVILENKLQLDEYIQEEDMLTR